MTGPIVPVPLQALSPFRLDATDQHIVTSSSTSHAPIAGQSHHQLLIAATRVADPRMAAHLRAFSSSILAQRSVRQMMMQMRQPTTELNRWLIKNAKQVRQSNDPGATARAVSGGDHFLEFAIYCLAAEGGFSGDAQSDSNDSREQQIALEMARLEEDFRTEIRAKVHAFVAAGELPLGSETALLAAGDAYAQLVAESDSLRTVFRTLLARFGSRSFERMRRWLVATLAADLASRWLSREPQALVALRTHLHHAQSLGTILAEADLALNESERYGAKPQGDRVALAGDVVDLCAQSWAGQTRLEQLAGRYAAQALTARLAWYARMRRMVRLAPLAAHPNEESRQRLLDAVQSRYDALADQEERNA